MKLDLKGWGGEQPLIISGPCSAETELQVMETARLLAETGRVHVLRAGIWKPRTKPGHFEGHGAVALQWLYNAGKANGFATAVEVATAKHVEEALKAEIDILWIGARTTVNPFSVQEIADALHNVPVPVLVKNPVNPDVELWAGAYERILKANVREVGLVHRGFNTIGNHNYRNPPLWQIPIEMKRRYGKTAMICDPSHICGNRSLLKTVAQTALDLGFNGLMIESHIDPDNAWSDAAQQVTPRALAALLDELVYRSVYFTEKQQNQLEQLRKEIDEIDEALLALLSRRMEVADRIGSFKKENNVAILQTRRWNQIIDNALDKAEDLNLSREFIYRYLDSIHLESINHQNIKIYGNKAGE